MPKLTNEQFNSLLAQGLPWAHKLGVTAEYIGTGEATLRLPYQEDSTRPGGTISGPHMMMLADACMYAVVLSMIGEVHLTVTTNFNINFVQKPAETDLYAEGKIIKLGKRLAVMETSVLTGESRALVAHATGTYSIPPNRPDN